MSSPLQARLSRQPELRRFALRLAVHVAGGVAVGVAVAAVTMSVDRRAGLTLPLPSSNSQLLLGTLVGAVLTIAVFALWMRTVVVGLASSEASPRVLAGYLDDGFQRRMTGGMLACFAYVTAVTAALPSHAGGEEGVPAISSVMSLLVVLVAFSGVLVAIHQATIVLSMPHVVRGLADEALSVMARQDRADDPPPASPPGACKTVIRAPAMGWVQEVDAGAILQEIPAGATVTVCVNISDFVVDGDRLAAVDSDLSEDARHGIAESFTLVPTRAPQHDLAYAIQQLSDVAEHAMTPASIDTSTAHEALVHLRAILHRVIRRGTATGHRRGPEGRSIIADRAWQPADHLDVVVPRLVNAGAQDPTIAQHLRTLLRALLRTAEEVADDASCRVVTDQFSRLERVVEAGSGSR